MLLVFLDFEETSLRQALVHCIIFLFFFFFPMNSKQRLDSLPTLPLALPVLPGGI